MPRSHANLMGQTFGQLTVIDTHERMGKDIAWLCRCTCETILPVRAGALASGNTKSCGCRKATRPDAVVDMTSRRFHRLTVLGRAPNTSGQSARWLCRCDCGNEVVVLGGHLRSGNTKSCGCQRIDSARTTNRKHGMAKSLAYKRWETIKQRCTNPKNPSYPNYGGRGIGICSEWAESFEAFHAAVGDPPSTSHSLDRINNDGNYEPGNVRWATASEQQRNRRPYPPMIERAVKTLRRAGWTLIPPPGDNQATAVPDSSAN